MNKRLIIGGEVADKKFPITTTEEIFYTLLVKSGEKNISVNHLVNKILFSWHKRQKPSDKYGIFKNKQSLSNNKK